MSDCFQWPFFLEQLFALTFYMSHVSSLVALKTKCLLAAEKERKETVLYSRNASLQEMKGILCVNTDEVIHIKIHTHTIFQYKISCLTYWVLLFDRFISGKQQTHQLSPKVQYQSHWNVISGLFFFFKCNFYCHSWTFFPSPPSSWFFSNSASTEISYPLSPLSSTTLSLALILFLSPQSNVQPMRCALTQRG